MKIYISIIFALFLTGCGGATFQTVKQGAIDGALGTVLPGRSAPSSGATNSGHGAAALPVDSRGAIAVDNIYVEKAERSRKNMGSITVTRTEKNPQGQTKVALDGCSHPKIGAVRCGGYLFELTAEGWLKDEPITFDDLNSPVITVVAGQYYLKFYNWDTGMNRYTTGEFTVKPFVTNYVRLVLE